MRLRTRLQNLVPAQGEQKSWRLRTRSTAEGRERKRERERGSTQTTINLDGQNIHHGTPGQHGPRSDHWFSLCVRVGVYVCGWVSGWVGVCVCVCVAVSAPAQASSSRYKNTRNGETKKLGIHEKHGSTENQEIFCPSPSIFWKKNTEKRGSAQVKYLENLVYQTFLLIFIKKRTAFEQSLKIAKLLKNPKSADSMFDTLKYAFIKF